MSNPKNVEWPDKPVHLTDGTWDGFVASHPGVVVDFWAPWCGPCRPIGDLVEQLAKEYKGQVAFGKLNTDENQAKAMMYNVMSIPTLLFFKDGKLVDQIVGAVPKDVLLRSLKKVL